MPATVHLGIDVDTSSVKAATADVKKLNQALGGSGGTGDAMGKAGSSANKAGAQIKNTADVISLAERRAARAAAEMRRLELSGHGLHGSLKGLRTGVQNAAFQFGDLSVQMGMGTAASTAFALQMPQLLQGFGVLGAVLGTVAAIIIPLYRDGFDKLWASISATAKAVAETNPVLLKMAEAVRFLWENIEHLVAIAITFVTFMAVKWVAGFVAARVATMSLVGSLVALRTALIRTGIGAIIVLVAELALAIFNINRVTGNWGETLAFLGEVAREVWAGIVTSASSIPAGLGAVWNSIKADFLLMIAFLMGKWNQFLATMQGQALSAADAINTPAVNTVVGEIVEAQAEAERLRAIASGALKDGFNQVAAAVGKLRDKAAEAGPWFEGMGGAAGDIEKGTGGAAKNMKEMEKSGKKILEDAKAIADRWAAAHDGIVGAMLAITSSQNVMDSFTTGFQGIIDSAFSDSVTKEFDKIARQMTGAIQDAFGKMTGAGLSEFGAGAIGMGIGNAAIGVMNRDIKQVGSGLGSAVGGALGSSLTAGMGGLLGAAGGPIGMMLGGLAGGFIANILGGGDEDKWKQVSGRAFTGTTYEFGVNSRGTVNTQTDQGFSPEGRFAFDGLVRLTNKFNREIKQFVKATGGEVQSGLNLVVDQNAVIMKIAGRTKDLPYKGEEGKRFGEMISTKVAEIMALAGEVAKKSGAELTNAQIQWREVQKRFSETNVAILRDLGFSAKQIKDAQESIRKTLADSFNKEIVDALVDTGRATKSELDIWRDMELAELEKRRLAAVRTAKEIGGNVDLVYSSFRAQKGAILDDYKDMLEKIGEVQREAFEDQLSRYNAVLGRYEQRRSEILSELARRADEARAAEKALADARRNLAGSTLAPGGPLDLLKTLKGQFSAAIGSARGGNSEAASLAASLAQDLLQQGRSVYASGSGYNELFKFVNSQLTLAQGALGGTAAGIEKRLDAESFSRITEKNTASLLKGLSAVNTSIKTVATKIENLEKRIAASDQKKRVA